MMGTSAHAWRGIMTEAHDKWVALQTRRNSTPLQIKIETTAMVIIDMQEYFMNPRSPYSRYMEGTESGLLDYFVDRSRGVVEPNLQRLLGRFREHESRVIFTTVASEFPDGRDLSSKFQRMNVEARQQIGDVVLPPRTDPWARIVDKLAPAENEAVINKTTYGSFASTGLDGMLRNLGIDTLVIGGVLTNRCVEATVRDAADRGYRVVLVDDGTATFSQELQDMTMHSLMGSYAFVRTADEVLAILL
jgi:nicotinamidase-related amidase